MICTRVCRRLPAVLLWLAAAPLSAQAAVFTVVALPDTENYLEARPGYPSFPEVLAAQTQWIVDNRASENIAFVTHLGDVIHYTPTVEMPWADAAFDKLDRPGQQVPYSVTAGNHDLDASSSFNAAFGAGRYADYAWYKGSYNDLSHAQVFSAGGYEFLHINLQKDPSAAALQWAQGTIDANLGKPTIVSTHDCLTSDITRSTAGTTIWNNLVKNNSQVFLTLNGHTHPSPNMGVARMVSDNSGGTRVLQVLNDFEDYTTQPSGDTDTGYLRKLVFDTEAGKLTVQTYSPVYAAAPWLTDDSHQFSYDVAFLPPAPGTAGSPVFLVSRAAWDGGDGSWATAGNWNGGVVPQYRGDTATFTDASKGPPATVTLDGNRTVAAVAFADALTHDYSITSGSMVPSSTLTLDGGSPSAAVTVAAGSHTIAAPVILGQNAVVDAAADAGLTISGPIGEIGGPRSLSKDGPGTLTLRGGSTYSGDTAVRAGTLRYDLLAGAPVAIGDGATLTIAAGATVELAGATSGTSDGLRALHVVNEAAEGLLVSGVGQRLGAIEGNGSTLVAAGGQLTADSICQETLTIFAGGQVVINASAAATHADAAPAPEPGMLALLAMGGLCLMICVRRRRAGAATA